MAVYLACTKLRRCGSHVLQRFAPSAGPVFFEGFLRCEAVGRCRDVCFVRITGRLAVGSGLSLVTSIGTCCSACGLFRWRRTITVPLGIGECALHTVHEQTQELVCVHLLVHVDWPPLPIPERRTEVGGSEVLPLRALQRREQDLQLTQQLVVGTSCVARACKAATAEHSIGERKPATMTAACGEDSRAKSRTSKQLLKNRVHVARSPEVFQPDETGR
mmetsp:Transcript_65528/g.188891  ORF Transcript_65528/g.188891 Transcript_65528/m.188891 type:complete len:218 (+) Transcript_65528:765-1418(+)